MINDILKQRVINKTTTKLQLKAIKCYCKWLCNMQRTLLFVYWRVVALVMYSTDVPGNTRKYYKHPLTSKDCVSLIEEKWDKISLADRQNKNITCTISIEVNECNHGNGLSKLVGAMFTQGCLLLFRRTALVTICSFSCICGSCKLHKPTLTAFATISN